MSHSPQDKSSRSASSPLSQPAAAAPQKQGQPQKRPAGAQNPPGRAPAPDLQDQPSQQQQLKARPAAEQKTKSAAVPGKAAQGAQNRVGQNQAGQAQSGEDTAAADSRKVAARQENDRLVSANRREDGADRQASSLETAGGGLADAARRQSVERHQPSPATPQGEEGGEVGRDAAKGTQRTAGTAKPAGATSRNQTDKDRQAMKGR